jgi:protein HSPC020 homolog
MVTPLFPSLNARFIDPNWFCVDKSVDEEAELTTLEKEHQNNINELQQKYNDLIPAGGPNDHFEDDEEEEEDDNDDDDEDDESGTNDDDNDEELDVNDLELGPESPIINLA